MSKPDPYVITIDGPSGSGKGSLALRLAKHLNFHLLDSGAIYRLAALQVIRADIDFTQESAVLPVLEDFQIHFEHGDELSIPFLQGKNVSEQIRLETTGDIASIIARFPGVRARLLQQQRAFFQSPGLVADGRDMGTVVFPEARIKFFLYAAVEARVQRRYKQLINMGISANIAQLQADISARDERDYNRCESPLVPATNALIIDSSLLTLDQVTDLVMSHINTVF